MSAAAVFVSAFLLFQVQPIISKMILPWFGGGPTVWTTCMLFFQVFLLAGYAYAHALDRLPRTRLQGIVHIGLLAAALFLLPIIPGAEWKPPDSDQPQWRILVLLAAHVGLPYFLLAASAPLIQAWYSRASQGRLPYRLYALSNLGSLGALLSYPFLIEPVFDVPAQNRLWSSGFASYALLCGVIAASVSWWNLPTVDPLHHATGRSPHHVPRLTFHRPLRWLILSAFGSMSLLAVTNQICQDVAVVPFFWVVPLSVYLLTFIICFDRERWYWRQTMSLATVALVVTIAAILLSRRVQPILDRLRIPYTLPEFLDSLVLEVALFLAALFCICMLCHGELVRSKPGVRHVTLFYLMISAGGALGGIFVALVCPHVFSHFIESDIFLMGGFLLAATILLRSWWARESRWLVWWGAGLRLPVVVVRDLTLWITRRGNASEHQLRQRRVVRLAQIFRSHRRWWTYGHALIPLPILAASVLVLMVPQHHDRRDQLVARRNFYGVLSVGEYGDPDSDYWRRNLYNGRILHGVQLCSGDQRFIPTTYYSESSGIGRALSIMARQRPLRVATVGLGAGTIAAYGRAGDYYCFYEINPDVEQICREYFTFISDTPAEVRIQIGDARLSMENEAPQAYDVIALDAFSGDAIPAHLLTVEAFEVYLRHLAPQGVIAVHTSNRHLDLTPIVSLLAAHFGFQGLAVNTGDAGGVADSASEWLLLTTNQTFLRDDDLFFASEPLAAPDLSIRVWTDQYSNLFQLLTFWDKWRGEEEADEEQDAE